MKKTAAIWEKTLNSLRLIAFLIGITALSCAQDSIFYDISNEPEPRRPLITGSPTNMVVVRNQVFVGVRMSNRIYRFAASGAEQAWTYFNLPGGSLGELATDGNYLYALVFPDGNPLSSSVISRYNFNSAGWDQNISSDDYSIQTVYGAGGYIFAGGQSKTNYQHFAVMYVDQAASSLSVAIDQTSLLRGAATHPDGSVFLATLGSGIFRFSNGAINGPLNGTSRANITGIIETGGVIVAVSSEGGLYTGSSAGFENVSAGVNFTGAMSLWYDPQAQYRPSLLLLGIRGRSVSRTHGYREMLLQNEMPTLEIRVPGNDTPTSVKSNSKYAASLGIHPVESIIQLPDITRGGPIDYRVFSGNPEWEPPIFATTAKDGLWSYRDGEWNEEE